MLGRVVHVEMYNIGRTILQRNCVDIVIIQLILCVYISLFKTSKYCLGKKGNVLNIHNEIHGEVFFHICCDIPKYIFLYNFIDNVK